MGLESVMIDVSRKRFEAKRRMREIFSDTAAAALMIIAAVVAIVLSNTALYETLHHAMMTPIGITIGGTFIGLSFEVIVNDVLMAFFFLLVGCDLKYQMTVGALAQPKQAILPMVAALGGVAGPAIIFLLINPAETSHGWAIPTATDIAFALAVMSLLGDRVPLGAKVFFSTLAIADDLFAIVVIALFYSSSVNFAWLAGAAGATLVLLALNRGKVYMVTPYMLVGGALWLCFFFSGVHATLAGVVLAFTLPSRSD
ncbi:MAG: Na+/H+ antiporter NhaA, partial [Coriobacteriia bacterium]|nr:Na+/H+ antiporter NhaA [Coriobacteriia bacterium]